MTDEPLSQAEMDALLRAADPADAAASASSDARRNALPPSPSAREPLRPPQRFDRRELHALANLDETFARGFSTALARLLRSDVGIRSRGVDELTCREFLSGMDDPTCLHALRVQPLPGSFLLEFSYSMLYPIVDRLLGGGREPSIVMRRAPTQIEWRLANRIAQMAIAELHTAWQRVVDLRPSIERAASSPSDVGIAAANEVVAVARFEVAVGQQRGLMTLCMPLASLASVRRHLGDGTSAMLIGTGTRSNDSDSPVEVVAQLASAPVTAAELANLQVGDLIATAQDVAGGVLVHVDGIPRFRGRAGAVQGRKAVEIESIADQASG